MKLIDTHAHLFSDEFQSDLDEVVRRAQIAGVEMILLPNIDETTIQNLKYATANYPDYLCPMMGLHPTSVTKEWTQQLIMIRSELDENCYVAVGEIGVDLYWDQSFREEQLSAFEEQLKWSIEKDLPVSIHFRNALNEVIHSIERVGAERLRGVFHSFGGSNEELQKILALENFLVGINGVATFKNAGVAETLAVCPREKLILETDSPYLAPVPFRGKRNESSYITFIARRMASIWQISEEEVAAITTRNASQLFRRTVECVQPSAGNKQ